MELAIGSIIFSTYHFNYFFGDKELLARQVEFHRYNLGLGLKLVSVEKNKGFLIHGNFCSVFLSG